MCVCVVNTITQKIMCLSTWNIFSFETDYKVIINQDFSSNLNIQHNFTNFVTLE